MEQKRLTVIESYAKLRRRLIDTPLTPRNLWLYQELHYRIGVIEACQAFQEAAPISDDTEALLPHYQMLSAFFQYLIVERRFSLTSDPKVLRQQDTARENLQRIIEDHRSRFQKYAVSGPEQYKKDIGNVICTVLPAWMQYRDSMLSIKLTEEDKKL